MACRPVNIRECRDMIMDLSKPVADLCQSVRVNTDLLRPLADIIVRLSRLSDAIGLSMEHAVFHKLSLNRKKYPVSLCKVR